MLDDRKIRKALLAFLGKQKPAPRLIVEELNVHNGNAIVDVVAIYESMHGFEIKGETDKVARVIKQSEFYNLSLPKLTLVTTENHLPWVERNLPDFWGVLIATKVDGGIKLRYHRSAKTNPEFSKEISLLMLWKNELLNPKFHPPESKIRKSDTRICLAAKVSKLLTKKQIVKMLSLSIERRKSLQAVNDECQVRR